MAPVLTACMHVCLLSLMTPRTISDEEESSSENDHAYNAMVDESDEDQSTVEKHVMTCILCQGQLRYGDDAYYYSALFCVSETLMLVNYEI